MMDMDQSLQPYLQRNGQEKGDSRGGHLCPHVLCRAQSVERRILLLTQAAPGGVGDLAVLEGPAGAIRG